MNRIIIWKEFVINQSQIPKEILRNSTYGSLYLRCIQFYSSNNDTQSSFAASTSAVDGTMGRTCVFLIHEWLVPLKACPPPLEVELFHPIYTVTGFWAHLVLMASIRQTYQSHVEFIGKGNVQTGEDVTCCELAPF